MDEGVYESLIKQIIHQQINLCFAQQLVVGLAREYGESISYAGHTYAFFLTPSQLAKVNVEELRQRKFNRGKAEYTKEELVCGQ